MPVDSDLTVRMGKDLDAILSLHIASKIDLGIDQALNGTPEKLHTLISWFTEMGVQDSKVAKRMIATARSEAISTALAPSPLLERLLLSGVTKNDE